MPWKGFVGETYESLLLLAPVEKLQQFGLPHRYSQRLAFVLVFFLILGVLMLCRQCLNVIRLMTQGNWRPGYDVSRKVGVLTPSWKCQVSFLPSMRLRVLPVTRLLLRIWDGLILIFMARPRRIMP
jgi:hypothetical protein